LDCFSSKPIGKCIFFGKATLKGFKRLLGRRKHFLKCFFLIQQIPWKKQARALSLILALISSLREVAGRRVVDVVVEVVDGVVVDEFPLGNLSSSSLQIPWKKQSITFCLSLCLASLERDGRAVVVVVVVVIVDTDSVVGLVYTSF